MAKKQEQKKSAKNTQKAQEKKISDKTFGLKNKNRSSVVRRHVEQTEAQLNGQQQKKQAEKERLIAEKKAAEAAKAEARALFSKAVPVQKVEIGVDPKSVVCAYFKQGLCSKGAKCKFSHDLSVERKGEKRDIYTDKREEQAADTMDKWDDKTLQKVILSKHGTPQNTTDKICKYFIEAVENSKYGWFWICPNGGDTCKYRHSLPTGFKLKTKEELRLEKQAADASPVVTLEDFIETERAKLSKERTPITFESFKKWKARFDSKKAKDAEEAMKNKKTILTGRELMLSGRFSGAGADETEDMDTWDLTAMRRQTERELEVSERNLQETKGKAPIAV